MKHLVICEHMFIADHLLDALWSLFLKASKSALWLLFVPFLYTNNICLVNYSSGWNFTPIVFLFVFLNLLFDNSVDS